MGCLSLFLHARQIDRRVFPSSVNLKVELIAFTFVDAVQTRTLNRADMHKGIRLAIIAHEKAEPFGCVEEFNGASDTFTGQLTLGRAGLLHGDHLANDLQILRRDFPAAINKVEFQLLTFGQAFKARALNGADVNEHIFAAGFLLNKAKAFLAVKELNSAFAGADNLRGHTIATAATSAAAAATESTTVSAAAISAAIATAAVAAAVTTAAAITTAITATKAAAIVSITGRRKAIIAAAEGVKAVFAESVALVPAAPTSSIVTHI